MDWLAAVPVTQDGRETHEKDGSSPGIILFCYLSRF